jgi:serine/threonine-protein kinase ULK4
MNNYHIYDEIGRGKASVVYKGRKKKTIEYLAVKSVEKHRRNKILNEVRIMHTLDHENILKFFNWYETKNHLWIIFEYCPGGSLQALIEQDKKVTEEAVRSFGFDLVKSLLFLHSSGILFNDLKPSNILFTEYGVLKLADFGLATRLSDLCQEKDLKKGTPCYMAPELFQEDGVHSFYSDLWSLGCVLYELASGQPPAVSSSFQDLVQKIVNDPFLPLPEFSGEFNQLLRDLLQKDCSKRISWEELVLSPVWYHRGDNFNVELPNQPLYEKFLRNRGLVQRSKSVRRESGQFLSTNVDVLRISQNLQKNILRESQSGGYEAQSGSERPGNDVKLTDKDQVVDFGEHLEDEIQNERSEQEILTVSVDESFNQKDLRPLSIQVKGIGRLEDDKMHQRTNSAQTPSSIKPSAKLANLQELLFHSSDYTVKPIIGNRDIEKPSEVTFTSSSLGFLPWSSEDVLSKSETQAMSEHFHSIFSLLTSQSTEKSNILNYFETLILNSAVANKLINSEFISLFVKLLKTSKSANVKIRICSIIGQMIRHATLISPELSSSGLCQILAENLKEKTERLRKKAIAALGEYLFYAATQMDDVSGGDWEIPNQLFATILKIVKSNDDEIFRFYACKTIENICAQSKKAGSKFAVSDISSTLISILLTSKSENFRCSATVALSHILRLNPSQNQMVIEKLAIKTLTSKLTEETARTQQALLTIILSLTNGSSKFTATLAEDRNFCKLVSELAESNSIVIRGKALLVLHFLCKSSVKVLSRLADHKFFALIEKTMRDSYKYIQNCFLYLLESLNETALSSLKLFNEEISNGGSSLLPFLPVIQNVLTCSAARSRLSTPSCIKVLGDLFSGNLKPSGEVTQQVLGLVEAFSVHSKNLVPYPEEIIQTILPGLFYLKTSKDTDIRFRSLKVFTDLLVTFLYEDSVYDPNNLSKAGTKLINDLIVKQVIPALNEYLQDQDPIPLYSLKLLSSVIERCIAFLRIVKVHGLFPVLLDSFNAGSPKLNLHLVMVVKKIIESQENSLEELVRMGVLAKVNSVMKIIFEQDWCVESMLDILYELLFLTADAVRGKKSNQDLGILRITESLGDNFALCTRILKVMEEPVFFI